MVFVEHRTIRQRESPVILCSHNACGISCSRLLRRECSCNNRLSRCKISGTHQQFDFTKSADCYRIRRDTRRSGDNRNLPALEEIPDHRGVKLISGNEELDPLVA